MVAARVWGDSSLWYLIGERTAHGSRGADRAGEVLRIRTTCGRCRTRRGRSPFSERGDRRNDDAALPPPLPDAGGRAARTPAIIVIAVAVIVSIYATPAAGGGDSGVAGVGGQIGRAIGGALGSRRR